jgi:hypothetical protein
MMRIETLCPLWFNEATTEPGRDAIGFYHEQKDETRGVGLGPEHDWSSHAGMRCGQSRANAVICARREAIKAKPDSMVWIDPDRKNCLAVASLNFATIPIESVNCLAIPMAWCTIRRIFRIRSCRRPLPPRSGSKRFWHRLCGLPLGD